MRNILISLLLLAATSLAIADGGGMSSNGGGLAEANIKIARLILSRNIINCLESKFCWKFDSHKKIGKKILSILNQELQAENQIHFLSGKNNPGFFIVDGKLRIAKTGNEIQDIIYFNTDLLYQDDTFGPPKALTLARATSILFHEYGHHARITDLNLLDAAGANLGLLVIDQVKEIGEVRLSGRYKFLGTIFTVTIVRKGDQDIPYIYLPHENRVINLMPYVKKWLENGSNVKKEYTKKAQLFCKEHPNTDFCSFGIPKLKLTPKSYYEDYFTTSRISMNGLDHFDENSSRKYAEGRLSLHYTYKLNSDLPFSLSTKKCIVHLAFDFDGLKRRPYSPELTIIALPYPGSPTNISELEELE